MNNMQNNRGRLILAAMLAAVCVGGPVRGDDKTAPAPVSPMTPAGDEKTVTALSRPSLETKLTFAAPGLVKAVMVQEGDHVKAGQVLAQQDDRQDQADLTRAVVEANSVAKIENYQTDQRVKNVQLKRKEELLKGSGDGTDSQLISQSEVEEARLDVELAKTQVELAELEHTQKGLDAEKQKIKVDLEKLTSPIDGIVEKRNINPGEMASADPGNRDGSIVVVQNDPLWVEVHLPTAQALQLKLGQSLPVKYPNDPTWQPARIIFFSPQADAASDTELVRLELPNPSGMNSGLQVQVKLPGNVAAVAESNP
jgi:RND family efflux transporter MFP subunit